jgi:beta-lactamase superfamily II metal-dependent hydrolase
MITIEMLPAAHGDALWIEYGSTQQRRRILIDGGPAHTYETGLRKRMALEPEETRVFELMVVTHIDADHIDGALILLQDKNSPTGVKFHAKEFWFNAFAQLPKPDSESFAPLQGEFLNSLLTLDTELERVWNKSFNNGAVMVPDDKPLPEIKLDNDAKITMLGPTTAGLRRLRSRWSSAIRDFDPGDAEEALRRLKERRAYKPPATQPVFGKAQYGSDRTPANGSSISFLLEHDGVSVLLLGDSHAGTIATSLGALATQRSVTRLNIDAVKLPHHGSMANVNAAWLKLVDCERWLISTSGAVFGHPDIETAELIAEHCTKKPTFYCNYLSDTTRILENNPRWSVTFPEQDQPANKMGGFRLTLRAS